MSDTPEDAELRQALERTMEQMGEQLRGNRALALDHAYRRMPGQGRYRGAWQRLRREILAEGQNG